MRRLRAANPPSWILPLLVAAGIACRLVQYLWDRSFWTDEASLVLNIRGKTAGELLRHLDFNQAAPPLFLLAERGIFHLLGGSELSLRLLPLLLGCAAVVLFALLARRVLSPWPALWGVAIFAFSDRLIWHSVEVKQYGVDVFAAVLLTLIAAGGFSKSSMRRLLVLCLTATILIWFSYASLLVFAALSLASLPEILTGVARWRAAALYLACHLPVIVSFAFLMHFLQLQRTPGLAAYWDEHFIHLTDPASLLPWLGRHLLDVCNYPLQPLGIVILLLCVLGAWALIRQKRAQLLAILIGPLLVNLVAAAAQKYPFDGARITAYLSPGLLLLAASGLESVVTFLGLHGVLARSLALAPAGATLGLAIVTAAFHIVIPQHRGHIRPDVEFMRAHAQSGDGIYVLSAREFEPYWPANDPRVHFGLPAADAIESCRFWIIWSYPNATARRRLDRVLQWAGTFATEQLHTENPGGCAFLFERTTEHPPHSAPPDISTHHKAIAGDEPSPQVDHR